MALVLADRVKETTTTTGTGTVTLAGVSAGYQSFAAIGNGNTTYYTISGQTTSEWEVGIGTYTSAGTTLSRTTVLSSSNGGSLVTFSAGTKDVFVTYPAGRSVNVDSANTVVSVPQLSATSITDSGNLTFTGTSNRITGDFSNATVASNVIFQTSTANSGSYVRVMPNGTATVSGFQAYASGTDPGNTSNFQIRIGLDNNQCILYSNRTGTGTYLPMALNTSGTDKLAIAADATGTYTFGGTAPRITGDFSNATYASRVLFQTSTVNGASSIGVIPNGTAINASLFLDSDSAATNSSRFAIQSLGGSETRISSTILGTGTYLPMTFYTSGSEQMRLDTSGNLGIGTTAGTTTVSSGLAINNATAASYPGLEIQTAGVTRMYLNANNAASYITSVGTNPLAIYTNSTERMRIDSSGNVGIGTTSTTGVRLNVQAANGWAGTFYVNSGGASTSGLNNYGLTFGGNYSGGSAEVNIIYGSAGAGLDFSSYNGTTVTQRVRLDSSGRLLVGTSSVLGAAAEAVQILQSTSAGLAIGVSTTPTSAVSITSINAYGNDGSTYVVGGTINFRAAEAWSSTNHGTDIQFRVTASGSGGALAEAMRIASTGYVGIGTTTPAVPLSVSYSNTTTPTTGSGSVFGVFNTSTSSSAVSSFLFSGVDAGGTNRHGAAIVWSKTGAWTAGGSNYGSSLAFWTRPDGGDQSERMRIDSSGNVGIGTSSPNKKLEVFATGTTVVTSIFGSTTGAIATLNYSSVGGLQGYTTTGASVTADITLQPVAGNVGIGSTTSAVKLYVRANLTGGTSNSIRLLDDGAAATSTSNNSYGYGFNATTGELSSTAGNGGFHSWYTANAERMRIDSSGNVLVTSAAGLGYGTGSGGTVTQATSKSTAVTLNKPTGQITMNNAALLPATSVAFQVNNTLISATDTIVVSIKDSVTSNTNYQASVSQVVAGAFVICLQNIAAGSLSEAVIINFALIKGATS